MAPPPDSADAFRAFVRDHHPDRGGDPEVFAAGLAAYGRGAGASHSAPGGVTFVASRSWGRRLRRRLLRLRSRPTRSTPLR